MARVPIPEDAGGPISQKPAGEPVGHILLAFPERQFINARENDIVAHVVDARPFFAGQAGGGLGSNSFASPDGADVDGMRESVLSVERPASCNLAIEGQHQSVVAAGTSVGLVVDGAESLAGRGIGKIVERANARADGAVAGMKLGGIAQVFEIASEDVHTVGAQIRRGEEEIFGKSLLNGKAPGFDVKVGMIANQGARD